MGQSPRRWISAFFGPPNYTVRLMVSSVETCMILNAYALQLSVGLRSTIIIAKYSKAEPTLTDAVRIFSQQQAGEAGTPLIPQP